MFLGAHANIDKVRDDDLEKLAEDLGWSRTSVEGVFADTADAIEKALPHVLHDAATHDAVGLEELSNRIEEGIETRINRIMNVR